PGSSRSGTAAPLPNGDRNAVSLETVELEALRRRTSEKWRRFPPDVLPSHIAEMDFAVAPSVEEALVAAVRAGDLGYVHARSSGLPEAFAAFAQRRWSWDVDPDAVVAVPDVMVGVAELLRVATPDGLFLSDEIHAPLTGPGVTHVPAATVVEDAIVLSSATKAWNLAGLKCGLAVAHSHRSREALARLPEPIHDRVGHLGAIAST